ncbi:MAG: hypothetical protein ACREQJ_03560, partial [Candidatus Binatia bacterium]
AALFGTVLFLPNAHAEEIRWRQIVGILAPAGLVGSGDGQVTGAPGPWSAHRGSVFVDLATGELRFRARVLVLAAGNSIGTAGPVSSVVGTLVCDTDGSAGEGSSVLVDSPAVPLSPDGDAAFSGFLEELPEVCGSEPDIAFLIRAAASGVWIGNGAGRRS